MGLDKNVKSINNKKTIVIGSHNIVGNVVTGDLNVYNNCLIIQEQDTGGKFAIPFGEIHKLLKKDKTIKKSKDSIERVFENNGYIIKNKEWLEKKFKNQKVFNIVITVAILAVVGFVLIFVPLEINKAQITETEVITEYTIPAIDENGHFITVMTQEMIAGDFKDTVEIVRIPSKVSVIDAYAFKDCKNLKEIYINYNDGEIDCISIGSYAFAGCLNLKMLHINRSNISLDRMTFPTSANKGNRLDLIVPVVYEIENLEEISKNTLIKIENTMSTHKHDVSFIVDDVKYITKSIDYGSEIQFPEIPIKTGHTFDCWMDEQEQEFTQNMPAYDIKLYAKWTINQYTIRFYVDDELYEEITQDYNSEIQIPSVSFPFDSYFDGWYNIDHENVDAPQAMPAEDLSLYGYIKEKGQVLGPGGVPINPTNPDPLSPWILY